MTVYVDDAFIQATVPNGARSHTSQWCHLTADSTEELVAFARKLGLRPAWIQYPGTWKEHFDVTQGKRAQARGVSVQVLPAEPCRWCDEEHPPPYDGGCLI